MKKKCGLLTGLTLSMVFAAAACVAPSSRPVDVEETIDTMCAAPAPVLVVDSFVLKRNDLGPLSPGKYWLDLDGDNFADMGHGDLVAEIVKDSGKTYIPYNIGRDYGSMDTVLKVWSDIVEAIGTGKIQKPAFINYSMSLPYTLDQLNALDKTKHFTAENIGLRRAEALQVLIDNTHQGETYRKLRNIFEKLQQLHVPVVAAAGNDYSYAFNLYSLMPGVITAGALDADGKSIADYSNRSSLVDAYRLGYIATHAVPGGISIEGSYADFPMNDMTRLTPLVNLYENAPLSAVLKPFPKSGFYLSKSDARPVLTFDPPLQPGIYSTQELIDLLKAASGPPHKPIPPSYFQDMAAKGAYYHYPSEIYFNATNGILHTVKPLTSSSPLRELTGTSFAAPAICQKP